MTMVSVLCRVCHVFPPLVSIFGLFPVLVSCHYELSMFQLCLCDCVNYPVYLVPVFWVWFRLVYSLFPGVSCLWALSCPALMFIKYYYLSLRPRLHVLVPPSCVHRDRRPDLTVSSPPSSRFVLFVFWRVFICSCVLCLSRGMEVAARYSRHSPLQVGVGVRRDRRECRESTGCEPSCPPIAGDIRRWRWLSQACRRVA